MDSDSKAYTKHKTNVKIMDSDYKAYTNDNANVKIRQAQKTDENKLFNNFKKEPKKLYV